MLFALAGLTGVHRHTQLFSTGIGSHELFCSGWLGTAVLLISASYVAGMTGMCHHSIGKMES
jgi:hypothetical protein